MEREIAIEVKNLYISYRNLQKFSIKQSLLHFKKVQADVFQAVKDVGKFRFPVYSYITEDEQTYGTDVKTRMVEFVYRCIVAPADQFDATYESGYNELVNAGLQKILDGRMEYFDSMN